MESNSYCESECGPDFDHDAIFDPYRWVQYVDELLFLSSEFVKVLSFGCKIIFFII